MKTTITITLEIEEEVEGDAYAVVETLLDAEILQDDINNFELDDCGTLLVLSAVVERGKSSP